MARGGALFPMGRRRARGAALLATSAAAASALLAAGSLWCCRTDAGASSDLDFVGHEGPSSMLALRPPREHRSPPTQRHFFGAIGDAVKNAMRAPEEELPSLPLEEPDAYRARGGPHAPIGFDTEMQELEVVPYPHPSLRLENKEIEAEWIGSDRLKIFARNLFKAMYRDEGGAGLAAPQVGVNIRMMVYCFDPENKKDSEGGAGLAAPQVGVNIRMMVYCFDPENKKDSETVLINPRITKYSDLMEPFKEKCLSFPRVRGNVDRPEWIEIEAVDIEGVPFAKRLDGIEARLFQHEYDHLDGIVFIDKLAGPVKNREQPAIDFLVRTWKAQGLEEQIGKAL
mmetsp:Transcript_5060/g.18901  ORF Transcript_5060/g.18901 Transcript_5060/m.18901 type:complete len:341 (+) Transcript_5060:74-1096(+)